MSAALYRTVWRWHFYAGLIVMPMVLILATSGSLYLFKPQIERWEERAFHNLPSEGAVPPDAQVAAALAAVPGAKLSYYRLPEVEGDAAMVHLALAGSGKAMRDVFVSPQGQVLRSLDRENRVMSIVQRTHGQLLLGKRGSWIVELAASWAIVMLITGVSLWWPKGRRLAGTLWPRVSLGGRAFLRDLHAVIGFWVAGFAMVLLLTGLPWADVWGSSFKAVRAEMGWVKGQNGKRGQDWTIGGKAPEADGEHADHDHTAMAASGKGTSMAGMTGMDHGMMHVPLGAIVARAKGESLPFPVLVSPPDAKSMVWTAKSDTQDRPLRMSITYDAMSGRELSRESFASKHPIDKVIGYGVAWHEGALFGWINQLIGLMTALALVALSVTGFLMWRRRKPEGALGAPTKLAMGKLGWGAKLTGAALFLLLPLFALSVVVLWLFDRLVLPRAPRLAQWLGMPA